MAKPIREQVVVITGASSGIGLLSAKEFARRGAKVALAARNELDLNRAVEEITRDGGVAIAVPTDVTDYSQVENLARRAAEAYGRVDTWVNNAAISLYAPFREVSMEDFRRLMDVNFMGQVHGIRAALPHLEATAGTLVCVGSTLSDRGVPLQSAYCASKHAIKGLLDSLRVGLQRAGSPVKVVLIKPSSMNTPLFRKAKTQLGVQPQPIPPIYEPELAAEIIIRAAEKGGRDLFVGGARKLYSALERLNPRLLDVEQNLRGFESQKTNWPKTADAPNNVNAPLKYDGGLRGEFSDRAKRRSAYQAMVLHPVAAYGLLLGCRSRIVTRT